ncbi:FISUMP domain-containing protein [Aestuariivivens insulae]|uniref:FISUMP domain-containing protein n=1 Tax=Aestuariivivens insulae TaxID=1621988 RepID=UPI001F57BAF1|nr:FISUMP domain-containing protein [Aestuariivivens insulae]
MKSYLLLGIVLCLLSCSKDNDDNDVLANQFTDPRDGQVYDIVTIGEQTWFAENLNYDTLDNLSTCYDDNSDNCFIYGRLYTGDAAQTACPEGWHLPSKEEWDTLIDYLGGIEAAHIFFKPYAMQQGKPVGFNLLAGGWYFSEFKEIGEKGHYYTSTDGGFPDSFRNVTLVPDVSVSTSGISSSGIMQNCRCIKD